MTEEKSNRDNIAKSLFSRESSGLIREINWLTAMFISMGFIAFYALPVSFLSGIYVSPNGLVLIAALLSWIVLLPHAYIWTKISESYQRTAADYVFTSRVLHPSIGVGVGLVFGISQMIFDAAIVYFGVEQLQTGFQAMGIKFGGPFIAWANFLSNPFNVLLVGAITFTLVILINIFLPKFTNEIMGAVSVVALASFVITGVLMTNVTPASISLSGTTFQQVVSASAKDTTLFSSPVLATIGLMVFTASFLPFVNGATSVAGEVRGGSKAFQRGVLMALVVSGILFTAFVSMTLTSLPPSFFAGAGVLGQAQLTNPVFDVILSNNNTLLDLFLAVGSFFWYVAIMFAVALFVSRYFMAVALDKALPSVVSYVNERFHSPVVAHLIDEIITVASLTIITVTPLSSAFFYGIDTADAMALLFGFIIVLLAVMVSILLKRGLQFKTNRGIMLGLAGIDLIVLSIYAYYWFGFSTTYLGIQMNLGTWAIIASPFIAGVIIYFLMKIYRARKEGINLDMTFKEIPPE